jgi:hypothetical protein
MLFQLYRLYSTEWDMEVVIHGKDLQEGSHNLFWGMDRNITPQMW